MIFSMSAEYSGRRVMFDSPEEAAAKTSPDTDRRIKIHWGEERRDGEPSISVGVYQDLKGKGIGEIEYKDKVHEQHVAEIRSARGEILRNGEVRTFARINRPSERDGKSERVGTIGKIRGVVSGIVSRRTAAQNPQNIRA